MTFPFSSASFHSSIPFSPLQFLSGSSSLCFCTRELTQVRSRTSDPAREDSMYRVAKAQLQSITNTNRLSALGFCHRCSKINVLEGCCWSCFFVPNPNPFIQLLAPLRKLPSIISSFCRRGPCLLELGEESFRLQTVCDCFLNNALELFGPSTNTAGPSNT